MSLAPRGGHLENDHPRREGHIDHAVKQLPADLALLLSALRAETDAKLSNLKAWGVAMTLGGGTLGGIIAGVARPSEAHSALSILLPFM